MGHKGWVCLRVALKREDSGAEKERRTCCGYQEASVELKKDPRRPLLLSAAVPADILLVVGPYRVASIAKSADFVNLMTYDLHTYDQYTPCVGHNSPLFPKPGEPPYFNTLNLAIVGLAFSQAQGANLWAELGMPKSKIMVGIPTYGRSWMLEDPSRW
ncbi:hypothetical protein MTO96_033376 [Rhipicephalus appendiculatus]